MLRCVAVYCSVLQCVAVCCIVMQGRVVFNTRVVDAICYSVLQFVAARS